MSTQKDKGSSLPVTHQVPVTEVDYSIESLQAKTTIDLTKLLELSNKVPQVTPTDIGKVLGITRQHVHRLQVKLAIIKGKHEHFRKHKADIYEGTINRIMDIGVTDTAIKKSSLRDCIISIGVLQDKSDKIRDKGSTVKGLSALLKGIHIDMKAGTITIPSPFPSQPEPIDITPERESPKGGSSTNSEDAPPANEIECIVLPSKGDESKDEAGK